MCKYCRDEFICENCGDWEVGCGQMGCTGTRKYRKAHEEIEKTGACPYCGFRRTTTEACAPLNDVSQWAHVYNG